jgi:transcriptional regulator with XRE-family HTH domain
MRATTGCRSAHTGGMERHSEFGHAVRRWRDRVAPESAGVTPGGRRRAAGLRREELAGLAGISVDYLTRLEQGRAVSPSTQVVEALARALRLTDREREHLFALAGLAAPGPEAVSQRITPSVQRLLDRLAHTPVAVFDASWTLIVANAPFEALMGETSSWRGIERNSVWRNVVGPGTRVVHDPAEKAGLEAGLVADLRLTASRHPADGRVQRLVRDLRALSPRFVELWETGEPPVDQEATRRKTVAHPAVGPIALDCDVLTVAGEGLHIMVYTAEPGTADAERLELAIVLGTQSLVE